MEMAVYRNVSLADLLRGWTDAIRRRRAYRATVAELRRHDERELEDLGFNRGEIPEVAARATFGS